ncbi:helix-turn-helix transcriptional regulator [Ketobacter sp. MCCC 1A13808]|uniref:winged helix-turn-helix transcriptional regulator n=1 Tax=Ketobacter sp. MCCC 1A13808 TaxID=2602738 RepID=UPI000F2D27A7|nr:helix-turn-helix domain-containing protein [Ketobacter sp. MCCC 1A13808]MVF14045.1 helix-turn-helix transcriptional regulator [Ketobacter sp. MCCC 1A13808]RLP55075.1 MAG: transcriptional regulator [Ketobacter sp.]
MASKKEHRMRSECPIACGLDIVGDHWTLLIVRDLLIFGRHEYNELLQGNEGIASNILSDRLQKLQNNDIVRSIPHPQNKRRKLYYLTGRGKDLIGLIMAIGDWTQKHLGKPVRLPVSHPAAASASPEQFKERVLHTLQQWEIEYGIH